MSRFTLAAEIMERGSLLSSAISAALSASWTLSLSPLRSVSLSQSYFSMKR